MPALVILAAGMGSRFGGAKQLTPVGPDGDAILDYSARDGYAAGFETVVLVTRSELVPELAAHVRRWPRPPVVVCQDRERWTKEAAARGRSKPLGTVHAALTGMKAVAGSAAAVVNADDFYGPDPYRLLLAHLAGPIEDGALVTFPLAGTVLNDQPVTRALCAVDESGYLSSIEEGTVVGPEWLGRNGRRLRVTGREPVSMNCWGFPARMADEMDQITQRFVASDLVGGPEEVLLPNFVRSRLAAGARVIALPTDGRCMGLTHPGDLEVIRPFFPEPAW